MQGPVGEERHQKESDGSHDKGAVHGDGGETFHYFRTAFAPVLGAQKDHDVPHSPDHLLKDKLDLVHRGDTGVYADITSVYIRDLSIHGFWNPRWGGGSWNQFTVNKQDDCI